MKKPHETELAQRTQWVCEQATQLGFALVGVARAMPSERADFVKNWLNDGRHGQMHYLANHLEQRLDPRKLLLGAKSVICVADFYEGGGGKGSRDQGIEASREGRGKVGRYAWGKDYHKVIKKRLHRLADLLLEKYPQLPGAGAVPGAVPLVPGVKTTVDTAPILEREHATRAGLGWIGKHTLLIHPQLGSWMLLGTIVTTLELAPGTGRRASGGDHCGTCTRCIDACPTQCIAPYALDASRCISYLTLEHRDAIDPSLYQAMGDWVAGCDVCQEVCPHNRPRTSDERVNVLAEYTPAPGKKVAEGFDLLEVLGWTEEDRRNAFQGSALKRIKLDMIKRNALIAAGNDLQQHVQPELRERIEQIAEATDEPQWVRLTATQVLDSLDR